MIKPSDSGQVSTQACRPPPGQTVHFALGAWGDLEKDFFFSGGCKIFKGILYTSRLNRLDWVSLCILFHPILFILLIYIFVKDLSPKGCSQVIIIVHKNGHCSATIITGERENQGFQLFVVLTLKRYLSPRRGCEPLERGGVRRTYSAHASACHLLETYVHSLN